MIILGFFFISKENMYNKLRNITIVIFHCIVLFYSTTVQWQ